MRFSNVEVERAYSDYLDSLDDWPPPMEELSAEMAATMQRMSDLDAIPALRTSPPRSMHA